jgi:hypothetical protein
MTLAQAALAALGGWLLFSLHLRRHRQLLRRQARLEGR